MNDNPVKRLLVDLDSLLDTRIATIAKINPEASTGLLNDVYLNRSIDDFEKITNSAVSNDEYKLAYQNRNKETLELARPTRILKLINEISIELEKMSIDTPFITGFELTVNIFPYDLTKEEQEALREVVYDFLSISSIVNVINKPINDITPSFLKNEFDGMIIYNFDEWFCIHQEGFNKIKLPRHLVFAPALYIKEPDETEIMALSKEGLTPFGVLEMAVVERFKLEMLRAREFSLELLT